MVVGRAGRLEERGAAEALGGHVDLAEAQDVAVELDAAGHVPHVQHGMVQAGDAHVLSSLRESRWSAEGWARGAAPFRAHLRVSDRRRSGGAGEDVALQHDLRSPLRWWHRTSGGPVSCAVEITGAPPRTKPHAAGQDVGRIRSRRARRTGLSLLAPADDLARRCMPSSWPPPSRARAATVSLLEMPVACATPVASSGDACGAGPSQGSGPVFMRMARAVAAGALSGKRASPSVAGSLLDRIRDAALTPARRATRPSAAAGEPGAGRRPPHFRVHGRRR